MFLSRVPATPLPIPLPSAARLLLPNSQLHDIQFTVLQFHARAREHQSMRTQENIHTRTRVRTKNKGLVYPRPQQGSGSQPPSTALNSTNRKSRIWQSVFPPHFAIICTDLSSPQSSQVLPLPCPSLSLSPTVLCCITLYHSHPSYRHPLSCHSLSLHYLFRVQRSPKEAKGEMREMRAIRFPLRSPNIQSFF